MGKRYTPGNYLKDIEMSRKIVHKYFPDGKACRNCGSEMIFEYNTPSYKQAYCPKCGNRDHWQE